ncbi:MAG: isocitrate lyase/phosphoenolpyruvate mutase family protein, partial [Sphaerochaetaceae bacterium]|nr:isocitrate lyase/phosphoenolpyruvate mutase family protein [Sphaerochaetaceae bacterium]
ALIARTDAYHVISFDEAISRCNDAIDAGADISFIEGCATVADIEEAGKRIKGPKMFAMLSSGASPKVTVEQCAKWGYRLITMHYAMFAAVAAMESFGKKCFEAGSDIPITDDPNVDGRPIYLFEKFGIHEWFQLGKKFGGTYSDTNELEKRE